MIALRDKARKVVKAARLMSHRGFRHGLLRGVAAAIEHRPVLRSLTARTVVDIGANQGQFSLLARAIFPQAKIYAFEPQPGPAALFLKVFPESASVRLIRAAISERPGTVAMHVSRRHDNSSLLPISKTMAAIYPGTEEIGTIQVEAGPLRKYLNAGAITAPALLKIDVQGAELDVLKGCSDLLQLFETIYVELSFIELYSGQALFPEVVQYLDHRNFALAGINNVAHARSGTPIQADCLFVRKAAQVGQVVQVG